MQQLGRKTTLPSFRSNRVTTSANESLNESKMPGLNILF